MDTYIASKVQIFTYEIQLELQLWVIKLQLWVIKHTQRSRELCAPGDLWLYEIEIGTEISLLTKSGPQEGIYK
jgi:hypothetical protein